MSAHRSDRPFRVLVLCAHNRARSVMASALLRSYLPVGFTVASAGFGPEGKQAIPMVVELLAGRGIDVSSHRSRAATRDLVRGADLVLTAEKAQVVTVVTAFGGDFDRTFTLPEFAQGATDRRRGLEYLRAPVPEVADPTGRSSESWQTAWHDIDGWAAQIATKLERGSGYSAS